MNDENMGKITILLSNEADKRLRARAKRNLRSISKEVEHMLYLLERHDYGDKDKVK